MNVKERLKKFINYEKITIRAFEESINASNGYVNSIHKSIGIDKLDLMIERCSNLNIEWLLTGKGEMIKDKKGISTIYGSLFEQERALYNLININNTAHQLYADQIELLKEMNEERKKTIIFLETEIKKLQNEIDQLKKEHPLPSDHTKPTHSKQ